jgi:glycosyltransferase 2 family protein
MTAAPGHGGEGYNGDRPLLAVALVAGVAFVTATVAASIGDPAAWEIALFEALNDLPGWLYVIIWPFMQYGVFVTIPIASVVAWWLSRRRLAVLLATSGVSIYLLAKVVKDVADRGRPDAFLDTVNEREQFATGSLGYTSGHAAVAATIATLTWIHLPRPWREISAALVVIVGVGRMYVGAHLPLDIIGGIAMGVSAGAAATYVSNRFGSRRRLPASEGADGGG